MYQSYEITHRAIVFEFYGYKNAKYRFTLYQGRRRAPEEMVKYLFMVKVNTTDKRGRKDKLVLENQK